VQAKDKNVDVFLLFEEMKAVNGDEPPPTARKDLSEFLQQKKEAISSNVSMSLRCTQLLRYTLSGTFTTRSMGGYYGLPSPYFFRLLLILGFHISTTKCQLLETTKTSNWTWHSEVFVEYPLAPKDGRAGLLSNE
jgi:hypothetical protein